mmetsp:Transcript_5532/g.9750  ORF Transcript_5532/g.9750 Transcript_5532/m.9750 type:complete len:85 (+) Transcript_5532:1425-1679(+)
MTIVVRPSAARFNASWTTFSLLESNALVASSNSKIFGFRTNARAIAIRCRCPPEIFPPFSPTSQSYPPGKSLMNSSAFAIFAAN